MSANVPLNHIEREIIRLRLEGLSMPEIAAALGMSLPAANEHFATARNLILRGVDEVDFRGHEEPYVRTLNRAGTEERGRPRLVDWKAGPNMDDKEPDEEDDREDRIPYSDAPKY